VPSLAGPLSLLRRRREVARVLRQELARGTALVARLPSETGLLAVRIAQRLGIPHAIEVSGCPWNNLTTRGGLAGKLYAPLMTLRMKMALAQAPFAMYVTRSFLQQRYPCVSGITEACSNVEIDAPSPATLERRLARIAAGSGLLHFGMIASLSNHLKGVQVALKALAAARNGLPPFELRVLGTGDNTRWKQLAQTLGIGDAVQFCGTLPAGTAVMDWLDDIDVYLQPSLADGLPRGLIEAMSRGCPALGSSVGGIPELLEAKSLHRPGDAQGLARLVRHAVLEQGWRLQQAERNWSEARTYARDVLEHRRGSFWARFAAYAVERQAQEPSARANAGGGSSR
jgi:glycosyltransferase involved in cell wall biosynthesis